jgi:opine dehydrogenase
MAMPATQAVIHAAGLILGRDLATENDLIAPLALADESIPGMLARINAA